MKNALICDKSAKIYIMYKCDRGKICIYKTNHIKYHRL